MDLKESLKQQIDQLASELGVPPGYAKNASEDTLQNRLAELEALLPDEGQAAEQQPDHEQEAELDQAAEAAASQQPETEVDQQPEAEITEPLLAKGERVTSGLQQITASHTFKANGDWVKAGETVTVSAEEAAEHIKAKRAILTR